MQKSQIKILTGGALDKLGTIESDSVQCVITSPPYFGLRDYGMEDQIGLEPTVPEYIGNLVEIFAECHRVLKDDGTMWIVIGDSYAGSSKGRNKDKTHKLSDNGWNSRNRMEGKLGRSYVDGFKPKDLMGIPWRLAFALQYAGWWLRQDIIWNKLNALPESVKDRCTNAHEYIFLLTKSRKYYYNADAIKEPTVGKSKGASASFKRNGSKRGKSICPNSPVPTHREDRKEEYYDGPLKNKRSVWNIAVKPYKEAHFAVFPKEVVKPCLLAGTRVGDIILDPFAGSFTVGEVAIQYRREAIGIELNPAYVKIAQNRIKLAYEKYPLTSLELSHE